MNKKNRKKRRNHHRVPNNEAQIEVQGAFAAEPTSTLRSVAKQMGIPHESERKALKIH